ncbi:MAG: pilus assembly protein PapC [Pseudomonas sp. PGPPP1]|uniref:CS1-pili formation C-terminal domain-containing protein n=3 Tax=Gammaproteobacteria TaxID=1236 RepID=UPI000BCD8799|nr:CS1-pili formation C-terminal domain-containing protein [Pseudomonas sp. PGPPP1]OYU08502.1 MAG: pilus assembly protein PapC [Pseudomonas sp. PGPPP1]
MFSKTPIAGALALIFCAGAFAEESKTAVKSVSLLQQAEGLPAEFHEFFFDVPLAVRVEVDQQFLGEAMILLSRDERVTLVNFTDARDSDVPPAERDEWSAFLSQGVVLGTCKSGCPRQLLSVHYSLEDSMVSLVTANAERSSQTKQFHDQPEDGSVGLIVRNQLNISGGQQQNPAGRYGLEASASLGNWTHTFNAQISRMAGVSTGVNHAVHELHAQREMAGTFVRAGYFTPTTQGLTRPARTLGLGPDTVLGVMYGSSDSLVVDILQPSLYPITVTPNRQAVAEIYRNGMLINSQQVASGLQTLDTRPLPGGIYEVEVRLLEDGQVISSTSELIYKPANWGNPENRWRYNLFAGRESRLLSNWQQDDEGAPTAGAAFNFLLHPRVVLGLSARQVKDQLQLGTSAEWTASDKTSLYTSVSQTKGEGTGIEVQGVHRYDGGSLVLRHQRSWLDTRNTYEVLPDGTQTRTRNTFNGQTSSTALSLNQRISSKSSVSAQVSHSQGYSEGVGVDLSWTRNTQLFGHQADWRVAVFDRPGTVGTANQRDRGIDLSVRMALGSDGHQLSGSVGSRTSREGARDANASVTYRRDLKDHVLQSVSATASSDTYGTGLAGTADFKTAKVSGSAHMQQSSYNGAVTGGLNLDSTLAISGKNVVFSSQSSTGEAGMIVDVESDLDDIQVRADDFNGTNAMLRPGRNFIPVSAYKSGTVSFDFEGNDVPAASIQPARTTYHLNKGGVEYRKIRIVKTVTVMGRLLDAGGKPLKGHHVINHASRGVSEVDGFFSLEMSESSPTLEVRHNSQLLCQFRLDPANQRRENDVLMVGDLRCHSDTLADAAYKTENAS